MGARLGKHFHSRVVPHASLPARPGLDCILLKRLMPDIDYDSFESEYLVEPKKTHW